MQKHKLIAVIEFPDNIDWSAYSCEDCIFNHNTNKEGINGCGEIHAAYAKLTGQNADEVMTCSLFNFSKGHVKFVTIADDEKQNNKKD